MTDRLKGVTVLFEKDIREDDAEPIINAIRCIRGVAAVNPTLKTAEDWHMFMRLRGELGHKIISVFYPEMDAAKKEVEK